MSGHRHNDLFLFPGILLTVGYCIMLAIIHLLTSGRQTLNYILHLKVHKTLIATEQAWQKIPLKRPNIDFFLTFNIAFLDFVWMIQNFEGNALYFWAILLSKVHKESRRIIKLYALQPHNRWPPIFLIRIYTLGLHSVEHKLVMKAEHCMVFYVVGYSLSLFWRCWRTEAIHTSYLQ